MPDLLPDNWSESDSSQDARDVEMDIVPDDHDENWVEEDEVMLPPHPSTASVNQAQATGRRARVEEYLEPLPSQSNHIPIPTPPSRSHTGSGEPQPSPIPPFLGFNLGTGPPPARLFPLFPDTAGSSGNVNNGTPRRDDTPVNPPTQPAQPANNPTPENAQRDARRPRFHAHTFVLGMDGSGRAIPIHPDAFPALFNRLAPATPGPPAQTPQPGQPPGQQDQTGQPDVAGDNPPSVDLFVSGLGALPPLFPIPGTGPQPDPGNGDGPNPGRGAPAWAELLRAMLGGDPPEEKEDPERAKKLVKGLERVTVGLVKRMTRVDGVPGAHEDSTRTDGGEAPGCAICWDSLLPSEDATFQSDHQTDGHDPSPGAPGPTIDDDDTSTAIICLPCSHVFHASCLLPWFSKPKHTTCPTCRFDIDPRNLTYTPPSRRPRPTPDTTTPQPQPVLNPTTSTVNPPPSPATAYDRRDGENPPLDPLFGYETDTARPGPDPLLGETRDGTPNNRQGIPPIFGFGPQQPPTFGPPPPPGHPTHGTRPTTNGTNPEHLPFPDFSRGGVGHAHFHVPGLAVDFTLHIPPEQGLDPERISQAVRDQAAVFLQLFAGGRGPGTGQPTGPTPTPQGDANREPETPREWMPPPAPGPTLRQRVEAKERTAGLRCDDPSCSIGPSDEDPFPETFNDPNSLSIKRVKILKDGEDAAVCQHFFHPACLVSADRCAGWGEKDRPSQDDDHEYEVVSCPVCRSIGKVQMDVWEEGAKALLV